MLLRLISLILLIASILTISSCQPDNEPKDNESPTIAFVQESQSRFFGTIDLTFDLKDNKSVARVEVFIDDSLLTDKTLALAIDTLNLQFDTKSVSDGAHKLKIIVTDANGNVTEKTFDITVRNTLLTITIPDNYFESSFSAVWIFLSDHTGNVIGLQQAHNNTVLTYPLVTDFNDETLVVHIFKYDISDLDQGGKSYRREIFSYTGVKAKNLILSNNPIGESVSDQGSLKISITDLSPGNTLNVSGSYINYTNNNDPIVDEEISITPHLFNEKADIMLTFYNTDGSAKYKLFENTKPGDELAASFNDFTLMNQYSLSLPNSSSVTQIDIGFRTDASKTYEFSYNQSSSTSDKVISYYPENGIFNSYLCATLLSSNNNFEFYLTHDVLPHSSYKTSDIELISSNFEENKIKMSFNGIGNIITAHCFYASNTETDTNFDSWNLYMPFASNIDFILPAIPSGLKQLYYPYDFAFTHLNNMEYEKSSLISSPYDDMVNRMFFGQPQDEITSNYEYFYKSVFISSGNERSSGIIESNQNDLMGLPDQERAYVKKILGN